MRGFESMTPELFSMFSRLKSLIIYIPVLAPTTVVPEVIDYSHGAPKKRELSAEELLQNLPRSMRGDSPEAKRRALSRESYGKNQ